MTEPIRLPTLETILAASRRIAPCARRTPLVELELGLKDRRVYLKLETLQPTGAFKIRPALNAILSRDSATLRHGVATVSSGNMALGLAWAARVAGVPMAAYMPPNAPRPKLDGLRALGGDVRLVDDATWWAYIKGARQPPGTELFIHPVIDPAVLAGNGTIGLEIIEDLPEVDVVLAPYGGGSLAVGVASAVKALKPMARVVAVEAEHATPLTAALAAGHPVEVPARASFIKSIGGPSVVPTLWPLAQAVIDGTAVVGLAQVVEAVQLLFAKAKIVAEGAGAVALAAAIHDPGSKGNVVCVVSGGNIEATVFTQILSGTVPT